VGEPETLDVAEICTAQLPLQGKSWRAHRAVRPEADREDRMAGFLFKLETVEVESASATDYILESSSVFFASYSASVIAPLSRRAASCSICCGIVA
jgi:hypothetical protein